MLLVRKSIRVLRVSLKRSLTYVGIPHERYLAKQATHHARSDHSRQSSRPPKLRATQTHAGIPTRITSASIVCPVNHLLFHFILITIQNTLHPYPQNKNGRQDESSRGVVGCILCNGRRFLASGFFFSDGIENGLMRWCSQRQSSDDAGDS